MMKEARLYRVTFAYRIPMTVWAEDVAEVQRLVADEAERYTLLAIEEDYR